MIHFLQKNLITRNNLAHLKKLKNKYMDVEKNTVLAIFGFIIPFLFIFIVLYYLLRRITNESMLPQNIKGMTLRGIVKRIPDGDGFKFYHVPCFRSKKCNDKTKWLSIRIAGIDAPETPSFGNPGQKGAQESKNFLSKLILEKRVKLKLIKRERYNRLLCVVSVIGFCRNKDVGSVMLKNGHACVYEGRDAEYDIYEKKYRKIEKKAKEKKLGMWQFNQPSPMEYKKLIREKNMKKK